jgi:cellulose synthase/poly-beta-1,6-N-acetylglucosamine synthase-like glycosyltransferase
MLEIIFLVFLCGYFIQSVLFVIGINKKFPKIKDEELPKATVVVAVRNEEVNILRCLKALDKLVYPEGKLEIIISDGHSTDKTVDIVNDFTKNRQRFKLISASPEKDNLRGKANAIDSAVRITDGEIILTTDADCETDPLWVKTICSYYKEDVGVVNGFTTQTAGNGFSGMQSLDFVYLLIVAAGTINLGYPISCIGNNMSYRKKAYLETGGYEALPFSVTGILICSMQFTASTNIKLFTRWIRMPWLHHCPVQLLLNFTIKRRGGEWGDLEPYRGDSLLWHSD